MVSAACDDDLFSILFDRGDHADQGFSERTYAIAEVVPGIFYPVWTHLDRFDEAFGRPRADKCHGDGVDQCR